MSNQSQKMFDSQLVKRAIKESFKKLDPRLQVKIGNLRQKIEPNGERRFIRTETGIGYRFTGV